MRTSRRRAVSRRTAVQAEYFPDARFSGRDGGAAGQSQLRGRGRNRVPSSYPPSSRPARSARLRQIWGGVRTGYTEAIRGEPPRAARRLRSIVEDQRSRRRRSGRRRPGAERRTPPADERLGVLTLLGAERVRRARRQPPPVVPSLQVTGFGPASARAGSPPTSTGPRRRPR
jgi:hypothetical protein